MINVEMCVRIAEKKIFDRLDVAVSMIEELNTPSGKSRFSRGQELRDAVSMYNYHKIVADAIGFDTSKYEKRFESAIKGYPELIKESIKAETEEELKASIKRVYGVEIK
jgi:hypothetical protein